MIEIKHNDKYNVIECMSNDEDELKFFRRGLKGIGKSVSLMAYDTTREIYMFDIV